MKILVIEDNEKVASFVEQGLREEGYTDVEVDRIRHVATRGGERLRGGAGSAGTSDSGGVAQIPAPLIQLQAPGCG